MCCEEVKRFEGDNREITILFRLSLDGTSRRNYRVCSI
jgi:hypothetical protein